MFSGCTVQPDSKETELGSSNKVVSPSADKSTRVALKPCCAQKCIPAAISDGVDISNVPGCHTTDDFSVRVVKTTSRIVVS